MSTIVTRAGKGAPLSFSEMDANLTNLNTDKVEQNTSVTFAGVTVGSLTGVLKGTSGTIGTATSGVDFQAPLVSGTNIKTINGTSVLGSGNITTGTGDASTNTTSSVDGEVALFSGPGGKTLKRATGSGIATVTSGVLGTAVSGTDIKTVNSTSLLGSGNVAVQDTLVSGTNIKTVNGNSLLGSGDLVLSGTGDLVGPASSVDSEIMLFSGTTGKLAKRASNTGIIKAASGVIATATAGTDYLAPPSGTAILKANSGGALANAVAGTDYLAPPAGTSILKANSGGALANAVAGTDYQVAITATGILKGAGGGSISAGTAGTDYVAPGTTTEFTKPQRPSVTSETAPSANAVTWDLTTNEIFRVNLNANITTFNLTGTLANLAGYQYEIIIRYNGGTTITWNTNFKWTGGTAPTLTGTSGKVDILTFIVASTDGTNFYLLNTGIKQNIG